MLPSSHFVPMNGSLVRNESAGQADASVDSLQIDGSCSRHEVSKSESSIHATSAALLVGEFSDFILAASRLENSYRDLQAEVSALGLELSERNAALNISLAEIERMRMDLQQIVDSMPCGVLVVEGGGK